MSTSGTLSFDDNYLISLAKSSINNSIISSDNQFVFLINFNSNNKQTIHSNSFFFAGNIIPSEWVKGGFSIDFNSEKTFGNNTEIFNGYFINDQIISKGIKSSNSFSFVGVGKSSSLSSTEKFALTIKNVFSDRVYNVSDDLNSANWRIYKINENSKSDQENIYSGWATSSSINDETSLGFNQGLVGLPILDYLKNNEDIFSKNILFTKNGSSKAIIINQKERGQNTKNKSSYGYYTRIDKRRIIDEQEFTFKFSASELFNSNKIKDINNDIIKSIALIKIKDFIINKYKSISLELIDDSETKKINVNNALSGANKKMKTEFIEKYQDINEYVSNKEYNSLINLLVKATPEVVSDKNILFTFKNNFEVVWWWKYNWK